MIKRTSRSILTVALLSFLFPITACDKMGGKSDVPAPQVNVPVPQVINSEQLSAQQAADIAVKKAEGSATPEEIMRLKNYLDQGSAAGK